MPLTAWTEVFDQIFVGRKQEQQLKDEALGRLELHRQEYLTSAREAAITLYMLKQVPITVDDIRKTCPPPPDIDPRVMGAVFKQDWVAVGYTQSKRKVNHGRVIRTFEPAFVYQEEGDA